MKVLFVEKKIEITKTFAEKAAHFGTKEYQLLRTAMQDLPDFQVTVKKTQHKSPYGNINYEQMRQYISTCDNSEELMAEFQKLREYGCNYGQIKQWFFRCCQVQSFAA